MAFDPNCPCQSMNAIAHGPRDETGCRICNPEKRAAYEVWAAEWKEKKEKWKMEDAAILGRLAHPEKFRIVGHKADFSKSVVVARSSKQSIQSFFGDLEGSDLDGLTVEVPEHLADQVSNYIWSIACQETRQVLGLEGYGSEIESYRKYGKVYITFRKEFSGVSVATH